MHEHAAAHLCVPLFGGYLQSTGAREQPLQAGQIGQYPAGHRHSNVVGVRGAVCLNLHVRDEMAPADFGVLPVAPPLQMAAYRLATGVAREEECDALSVECLVAELLGFDAKLEPGSSFPMRKLLERIEERPADSLTQLSAHVDRHPSHVARSFRHAAGISLGAYRRRLRLMRLSIELRADEAPLSELAARHGYSDQAHMSREFKAFSGISPGKWRRRR